MNVTRVFVLAEGRVPTPGQPLQIRRRERQPGRRIALMKSHHIAIKLQRFHRRGIRVPDQPVHPGQKLTGREKNRAVRRQLERILGLGRRLLA